MTARLRVLSAGGLNEGVRRCVEAFASSTLRADTTAQLGCISVGAAVPTGAPLYDLSSESSLYCTLTAAEALIHNRASSGMKIARLIERLGLSEITSTKTIRTQTGAENMEALARRRSARPLGFRQVTEIRLHAHLGIELAGILPDDLVPRTCCSAGLSNTGHHDEPHLECSPISAPRRAGEYSQMRV